MYVLLLTFMLAIGGMLAMYFEQALLFLVALTVPGLLWAAAHRPALVFGLCVVFGAYNLKLSGGPSPITPYKFATLGVVGIAALRFVRGCSPRLPEKWFVGPFIALTAIVCVSEMRSEVTSLSEILVLASVAMMSYGSSQVLLKPNDFKLLAIAVALGQLWMAASVWSQVGWSALNLNHVVRAGGLHDQPNDSAATAVFWFYLGLPLLFDRRANWALRGLAMSTVPAFTYVIFATASRGGAVAAVAGLVAWSLSQVTNLRSGLLAVSFIGIFAFGALTLAPQSFTIRMLGTVQFDSQTGEAVSAKDSGRRDLAKSSLAFIAKRPLLGGGANGSRTARARQGGLATTTHSTYLAIADSYGVPALCLVLFMLFSAARSGVKSFLRSPPGLRLYLAGMLSCLLALLVFSIGASEVIDKNLWLLMALISAARTANSDPRPSAPTSAASPLTTPRAPPAALI